MKKILITALLSTLSYLAVAESAEFVFNNDFRPSFQNFVTAKQLEELSSETNVLILDVRLEEDFAENPTLIPGAQYLNPADLPSWIGQLNKDQEVVVYCVAGKWVSQKVAHLLDQSGISVRSLEGGITGWQAKVVK